MRDMGLSLTKEQMTELYFVLDRDGDGEIDTKELLRALTDTRRAAQIGWMRFEEAEAAILNELSLVATPRGQVSGLSQVRLQSHDDGGSVRSNRSDRTNETVETTPANVVLPDANFKVKLSDSDGESEHSMSETSSSSGSSDDEE